MAPKTGFKQQCPHCEAKVPIKDESLVGEEIKCPKCKKPFVVEDPAEAAPTSGKKKGKEGKRKSKSDAEGEETPQEGTESGTPPAKKSNMMVIGLGAAAAALVLLGVASVLILRGGDKKSAIPGAGPARGNVASAPPPQTGSPAGQQTPATTPAASQPAPATTPVAVATGNPTNLLPNETEVVLHLHIQDLLRNPLGRAFLTAGASVSTLLQSQYGLNLDDLDDYILAANVSQDWLFEIVRTNKTIDFAAVQKALRLKSAGNPIEGQPYYVTPENWLENGNPFRWGESTSTPPSPGSRPLAVRLVDGQTLALGDLLPVQTFLKARGQFPEKPLPPGTLALPGIIRSDSYKTVSPRLKEMLDLVESKPPVLFSLAMDLEAQSGLAPQMKALGLEDALSSAAIGLQMKDRTLLMTGIEARNDDEAKKVREVVIPGLTRVGQLASVWGIRPVVSQGQVPAVAPPKPQTNPSPTAAPPPAAAPTPPPSGPSPGGRIRRPATPGGGGGEEEDSGRKSQNASPGTASVASPNAHMYYAEHGRALEIAVDFQLEENTFTQITKQLQPLLIRTQSDWEMMRASADPNLLANAVHQYLEQNKQMPRGAYARSLSPARARRPWPPDQRISWMADLLPFVGYESVYASLRFDRAWSDIDNIDPSVTLVPVFLAPQAPRSSWYVRYPGVSHDVAATHFVGIAGIGQDAAEYQANDPAFSKLAGPFGYDRSARLTDFTRGLARTILAAQIPPIYKSPWIAGGGSTVRGVPEKNSIRPFVCDLPDGKRGTYALMADGSVRYFSETTSDEVFKALCTLRENMPAINFERVAPKVLSRNDDEEQKPTPDTNQAPQKPTDRP